MLMPSLHFKQHFHHAAYAWEVSLCNQATLQVFCL